MSPTPITQPMSVQDAALVNAACELARPQFEQMRLFEKFIESYQLGGSRLAIEHCSPLVSYPDGFIMKSVPSGRVAVLIVGDDDLVQPYLQGIAKVMEAEKVSRPDVYRP